MTSRNADHSVVDRMVRGSEISDRLPARAGTSSPPVTEEVTVMRDCEIQSKEV